MVNIISWQIKHNLVKKSVPGQLEAKSMAVLHKAWKVSF